MLVTASLTRHWVKFEVSHVDTVKEAVAQLKSNVVDLVLLDLGLPDSADLDGLERISAVAPAVPIVVLTGMNDDEIAMRALRAGAQDFVTKGTHRHDLIARSVLYAVERRRVDHLRTRLAEAHRLAGVGELAASVAHAMNNPAAAVTTNVYWLGETLAGLRKVLSKARAAQPESAHAMLNHPDVDAIIDESESAILETQESLARLTATVQELVDLAKVWPEDVDHVQLNTVVHAAGNMARAERGLPVQITKDMGDLPAIKADRSKLTQAVTAILHFLARGGGDSAIRVATRHTGSHLVLTADRPDLVLTESELQRAPRAFGGADGGQSLGVASEIIRRHGGEMEVNSAAGSGTRVTVRIPESTGLSVRKSRPRGRNLTRPSGLSLKLLVVDQSPAQIEAYRRQLEPSHELTTATSGSEGLARLDENARHDAILVDLDMAGISGVEFFNRVSVKHPGLEERIVFLSANPKAARPKGTNNPLLTKPAQRGALLAALLEVSIKPATRG